MSDDIRALTEELKRHIDVSAEGTRAEVRAVAAGVFNVQRQVDAFRSEVERRFDDTHAVVKLSYSQLASRIETLESRVEKLESAVFGEQR